MMAAAGMGSSAGSLVNSPSRTRRGNRIALPPDPGQSAVNYMHHRRGFVSMPFDRAAAPRKERGRCIQVAPSFNGASRSDRERGRSASPTQVSDRTYCLINREQKQHNHSVLTSNSQRASPTHQQRTNSRRGGPVNSPKSSPSRDSAEFGGFGDSDEETNSAASPLVRRNPRTRLNFDKVWRVTIRESYNRGTISGPLQCDHHQLEHVQQQRNSTAVSHSEIASSGTSTERDQCVVCYEEITKNSADDAFGNSGSFKKKCGCQYSIHKGCLAMWLSSRGPSAGCVICHAAIKPCGDETPPKIKPHITYPPQHIYPPYVLARGGYVRGYGYFAPADSSQQNGPSRVRRVQHLSRRTYNGNEEAHSTVTRAHKPAACMIM